MTAVVGPNLGITAGHAPGDDSWGADMNLNLRMVDGLPWFTTAVAPTNTPPGSAALGDRFILGTAPTGAWSGHAAALAVYQKDETDASAWRFYAPKQGWEALVLDVSSAVAPVRYRYRGGAWGVVVADWNAGTVTTLGGGLGLSGGTLSASVTMVAGRTGNVTIGVADVTGAEATASKGTAGGYASLDGSAKVPVAQLPASVVGGLSYQGTWNASTNSPTLASGTGTLGNYYVVGTAGTTTIDGVSAWGVGDWISFDGTKWDKLDGQANPVSSVAGRQGAVTLAAADVSGLNGIASQTVPAAGLVYSDGSVLQPVTLGANVTFSGGTLAATGGGGTSIWNAGTVTALGPNLSDTGGTLALVVPTSDPGVAGELWVTSSGQVAVSGTPPELPLGFIVPGKPTAGQPYNLPIAAACSVNANFAGTVVYDGTQTTANAVFTVNKIHAGTTTTIGTLTITSASHTSVTLSTQAAVALAVGDVLQLVAPSSQDATLADLGITILTTKV